MAGQFGIRGLALFLQLLHQSGMFSSTSAAHGQAFIQTDKELHYVDGIIHDISADGFAEINIEPISEDDDPAEGIGPIYFRKDIDPPFAPRFYPSVLDFGDQPIGMLRTQQVVVHNPDPRQPLTLLSISGNTPNLHCSFFADKTVEAQRNTTFDVVFLPRDEGDIDNTLYIHAAMRVKPIAYRVRGRGTLNPYRLRPYLGARVPLNFTFSPMINMHNPHAEVLRLLAIFTSGGDLHLELPDGEDSATLAVWEIPPFQTKAVMRATFLGRMETNFTGYIRIKTSLDSSTHSVALPVEVEVSKAPGLFSEQDVLDFGSLRTFDHPISLHLTLINTGPKAVQVADVVLEEPNDAVRVDFKPLRLPGNGSKFVGVATITFSASRALQREQTSGRVLVKTKSGHPRFSIPYTARVLHGSLIYDENATRFFVGSSADDNAASINSTRRIPLTNGFNFSVVIHNVSLSSALKPHFRVVDFSPPVFISAQTRVKPFALRFAPAKSLVDGGFKSFVQVYTNISVFDVPLLVYDGRLSVKNYGSFASADGVVDLGTLGVGEKHRSQFIVTNANPIHIEVSNLSSSSPSDTVVELLPMDGAAESGFGGGGGGGVSASDPESRFKAAADASDRERPVLVVNSHKSNILQVTLTAPSRQGSHERLVELVTAFETIRLRLVFQTADGSLSAQPERVIFDPVYPGKRGFQTFSINSSFDRPMKVTSLTFHPNDTRFYVENFLSSEGMLLEPKRRTTVGRIVFDASKACSPRDDCFVGLPMASKASDGQPWLVGMSLPSDLINSDQFLYQQFLKRWENIRAQGRHLVNVTIKLDTSQVKGFFYPVQARLNWPELAKTRVVDFHLTQVGNVSSKDLYLENSGDSPVLVQVLMLSQYPNPLAMRNMLSEKMFAGDLENLELDDVEVFSLKDQSTAPRRRHLEEEFGIKPHNKTVALVLDPGEKFRLWVKFSPKDDTKKASVLVIRNNLTIVEAVLLKGEGARGELQLRPGNKSSIRFDLTEFHLKNCETPQSKFGLPPNFSVRKTLYLRNTGPIPVYILGYSFNGLDCEGYNFRVLDCMSFSLPSNGSRTIDIAFTPDFTLSHISRVFSLKTTLGFLNYTVTVTVPPKFLAKCAKVLQRPYWEPVIYYSAISLMLLLFFCVIVASYFEGDRILAMDTLRRQQALQAAVGAKYSANNNSAGCNHSEAQNGSRGVFDFKSISNGRVSSDGKISEGKSKNVNETSESNKKKKEESNSIKNISNVKKNNNTLKMTKQNTNHPLKNSNEVSSLDSEIQGSAGNKKLTPSENSSNQSAKCSSYNKSNDKKEQNKKAKKLTKSGSTSEDIKPAPIVEEERVRKLSEKSEQNDAFETSSASSRSSSTEIFEDKMVQNTCVDYRNKKQKNKPKLNNIINNLQKPSINKPLVEKKKSIEINEIKPKANPLMEKEFKMEEPEKEDIFSTMTTVTISRTKDQKPSSVTSSPPPPDFSHETSSTRSSKDSGDDDPIEADKTDSNFNSDLSPVTATSIHSSSSSSSSVQTSDPRSSSESHVSATVESINLIPNNSLDSKMIESIKNLASLSSQMNDETPQVSSFSPAHPMNYTHSHDNVSPSSNYVNEMNPSQHYLASIGLAKDLLPNNLSQGTSQIPDFSKLATTPPPNPATSIVGSSYPNLNLMSNMNTPTSSYSDMPPAMFNHPPPLHILSETSLACSNGGGLPPQLAAAYIQQQMLKSSQQQPPNLLSNQGMSDLSLPSGITKQQAPINTSDLSYNLLQRMQMQRRAERKEYHERRLVDENWPGFGGMMNHRIDQEPLWEPGMDADNQWPRNLSKEYDNSIWSPGGASAIWSPVGTSTNSPWFEGPDGFMAGGGNNEHAANGGPLQPQPVMPENASSVGLFSPFDGLRNIWRPEPNVMDPQDPLDPSHQHMTNEAMIMEQEKHIALQQMQQASEEAHQQSMSKHVWGFNNSQHQ